MLERVICEWQFVLLEILFRKIIQLDNTNIEIWFRVSFGFGGVDFGWINGSIQHTLGSSSDDTVGNVIEWAPVTGPDSEPVPGGTTLGFNDIHKHSQWSQDGGIADIIVERTLREGLGMFDGFDELATHYDDMKTEDK